MNRIESIYNRLLEYYGPQYWWPGDTPFEVIVGAILTQNTAWTNVEKAINNLKPFLEPGVLHGMETDRLAQLIRPSGFFNIKARRLKNFLDWFKRKDFCLKALEDYSVEELRKELLSINGIGRETADSIILYALEKPIFVIDAYTRRMFERLGFMVPDDYDDVRRMFEESLEEDTRIFNEYHALIVRHSKEYCTRKPLCGACFLRDCCPAGKKSIEK